MKLKCLKRETIHDKYHYYSNWHKKFAWLPVRVGSEDCRWLEYVERRGRSTDYEAHLITRDLYFLDGILINGFFWEWEYRPYEQ